MVRVAGSSWQTRGTEWSHRVEALGPVALQPCPSLGKRRLPLEVSMCLLAASTTATRRRLGCLGLWGVRPTGKFRWLAWCRRFSSWFAGVQLIALSIAVRGSLTLGIILFGSRILFVFIRLAKQEIRSGQALLKLLLSLSRRGGEESGGDQDIARQRPRIATIMVSPDGVAIEVQRPIGAFQNRSLLTDDPLFSQLENPGRPTRFLGDKAIHYRQ